MLYDFIQVYTSFHQITAVTDKVQLQVLSFKINLNIITLRNHVEKIKFRYFSCDCSQWNKSSWSRISSL